LHTKTKIILGIDPGTLMMGFGLIEVNGNNITLIVMDVLKLSSKKDAYERLQIIHHKVCELVKIHGPHQLAIEAPFFGKNVQSMLKLGRAQGIAIAVAMQCGMPVTEYSPRKIKQSITGNGNDGKEQVWKMLQQLLTLKEEPRYYDATDAVAVAMCHHFQMNSVIGKMSKGFNGWDDFIKKNPQRTNRK